MRDSMFQNHMNRNRNSLVRILYMIGYDRIKVGEVGGGGGMQIMYPVGHTTQEQTLKVLV